MMRLISLFLALLMLVGSFVMLVDVEWQLALIMFSVVPFIVLFAVLSRRSMSAAMKNSHKQIAEVNVTLENSISGIREMKSYVAEAGELNAGVGHGLVEDELGQLGVDGVQQELTGVGNAAAEGDDTVAAGHMVFCQIV